MTVHQPSTPKRRFLSGLFGGRKGDRISVANPTSIISIELMEKTGIFFPDAHLDPLKMAGLVFSQKINPTVMVMEEGLKVAPEFVTVKVVE